MKLKQDLVLRQVADTWVVLPMSKDTLDFNGMMTLNDSGALLWKALEQGCDREALAEILTSEYNVDRQVALSDAEEFLEKLQQAGCFQKE